MNGRPLVVVPTCRIGHDVGVAGEPTHRVLLAQEAVEIFLVKVGGQHLDRDRAVQQRLSASIHDAKATASDFGDTFEPRVAQPRGDLGTRSRCVECESTSTIDGHYPLPGGR